MASSVDLSKDLDEKLNLKVSSQKPSSLYVFGGQNQTARGIRDVDKIILSKNAAQQSPSVWTHLFDMEKPRSYFSACETRGKIYILGGRDGNKRQLSSIFEFSPVEMKWIQLPVTLCLPRSEFGVAVIGSKIFSVGGFGEEAAESIEYIDLEKNKVMKMGAKLCPARWGHGVVAYKDTIYAIGGQWYATPKVSSGRYHHSVQSYNIYSQKWSSCPGMLRRRGYHGVALSEDTRDTFIYALGGVGGELGNHRFSRLDCVERFNVTSPDIWTLITYMPAPLSNFGITSGCGKIYIVGGLETLRESSEERNKSSERNEKSMTVNRVHEYNCKSGDWTLVPTLIFPRRTLCAVFYDPNAI